MTLSPETEAGIRRPFFARHWKVGRIGAHLGVHHDGRRVAGLAPMSTVM